MLNYLSKCPLHAVASYDDAISLIRTPRLKQLPGEATLHHARTSHNHTRTNVIEMINILKAKGGEDGERCTLQCDTVYEHVDWPSW